MEMVRQLRRWRLRVPRRLREAANRLDQRDQTVIHERHGLPGVTRNPVGPEPALGNLYVNPSDLDRNQQPNMDIGFLDAPYAPVQWSRDVRSTGHERHRDQGAARNPFGQEFARVSQYMDPSDLNRPQQPYPTIGSIDETYPPVQRSRDMRSIEGRQRLMPQDMNPRSTRETQPSVQQEAGQRIPTGRERIPSYRQRLPQGARNRGNEARTSGGKYPLLSSALRGAALAEMKMKARNDPEAKQALDYNKSATTRNKLKATVRKQLKDPTKRQDLSESAHLNPDDIARLSREAEQGDGDAQIHLDYYNHCNQMRRGGMAEQRPLPNMTALTRGTAALTIAGPSGGNLPPRQPIQLQPRPAPDGSYNTLQTQMAESRPRQAARTSRPPPGQIRWASPETIEPGRNQQQEPATTRQRQSARIQQREAVRTTRPPPEQTRLASQHNRACKDNWVTTGANKMGISRDNRACKCSATTVCKDSATTVCNDSATTVCKDN